MSLTQGVAEARADALEGLQPAPEAHAGRVRVGVHVASQHHVRFGPLSQESDGDHSLQFPLALVVDLEIREVIDQQ
ncbi:hypothetical protein [Streptomyces sp. NPDC003032]